MIKSGLRYLKEKIKDMSKQEKIIGKADKMVNLLEMILYFNRQQGQGLKIFTPNQMFSRLPISLAQLKAGNSSEKLKNETRQLLYSSYRSKNLQNICTKVWLTLFQNVNTFYEQRKQ